MITYQGLPNHKITAHTVLVYCRICISNNYSIFDGRYIYISFPVGYRVYDGVSGGFRVFLALKSNGT